MTSRQLKPFGRYSLLFSSLLFSLLLSLLNFNLPFQGVVRLPSPQVSDSSIKVELPNSLFESIETHGMGIHLLHPFYLSDFLIKITVTLKHTGCKSPEEPIPATPSTQTTPPVSVGMCIHPEMKVGRRKREIYMYRV